MAEEFVKPKVCAVCGQVLDQYQGQWVHAAEVIGKGDHVAVPVDYEAIPVVTRCDFCYAVVDYDKRWTLPARDFMMPMIGSASQGAWAACEGCAILIGRNDWDGVITRHLASPETSTPDSPVYRSFLGMMYATLREHVIEPVRPWRAGDERTTRRE